MERVTRAQLTRRLGIATLTLNRPAFKWTRNEETGQNECTVGALYIEHSYGGYKLCETVNNAGGERDLSQRLTAREMLYFLDGMMAYERLLNDNKFNKEHA
jgi:hypothetical protein